MKSGREHTPSPVGRRSCRTPCTSTCCSHCGSTRPDRKTRTPGLRKYRCETRGHPSTRRSLWKLHTYCSVLCTAHKFRYCRSDWSRRTYISRLLLETLRYCRSGNLSETFHRMCSTTCGTVRKCLRSQSGASGTVCTRSRMCPGQTRKPCTRLCTTASWQRRSRSRPPSRRRTRDMHL